MNREKETLKNEYNNNKSSISDPQLSISHELNDDLIVSRQKDSYYQSWMVEYIVPNSPAETLSPREVFFEVTNKKIKIYQEVKSNLLEEFNLTNINWVCYKEYPCLPSEMMNHYKYSNELDLDLNLVEATFTHIQDVIPDEKQCMAFEFFINSSILTEKRVFCMAVLNEKILEYLQKAIISGYHESVKSIPFELIRTPNEYKDQFFVEYIAPGSKVIQSININFGEMGIEYEKETLILYQSPENCDFCFDVMEKLENIHTINKCCLKFYKNGAESYICALDAYRCDMKIKQIAKYMYFKCLDFNKNALDVHTPGYCLVEKKTTMKYFSEAVNSKNDMKIGKMLEQCGEEHVKSIKKSLDLQQTIETHLLRVNQEMNRLNKEVASVEKNGDDIINHNKDGTKTIIKPNKTKIIEDDSNSIRTIIKNDNTIDIIYFDGAEYIMNGKGENIFHLRGGMEIKIKKGEYEVHSPEVKFHLYGNGTAFLKETNGKNTYFESETNITTILRDGTIVKKKSSNNLFKMELK